METSLEIGIGRETPHEQDWWPLVGGDMLGIELWAKKQTKPTNLFPNPHLGAMRI